MKMGLSKYIDKLFFKKWILGVFRYDINKIIRTKTFDAEVKWLWRRSYDKFYADPFILGFQGDNLKIILEEFSFAEDYGKISLMTLDRYFKQLDYKILLDTKSHLSYPFIFTENNKTFIFPEAAQSGKFSCYEYDPINETMVFVKDILDIPFLDSTIIKKDGKYWLFGSIGNNVDGYKLYVYFSDNLLGLYSPHPENPIKEGLNGTRPAGNFIEVDGNIYRPAQNCERVYGESMTINKVTVLNENEVTEEFYMTVTINRKARSNFGMHAIHTINTFNDIIVVDGIRWTFAPVNQIKFYLMNRRKERMLKENSW